MRNYVMALLVSACMLSRSAFAIGFCDNVQIDAPNGSGNCRQTRTTPMTLGAVSPSYSDLDMARYWDGPDVPISFTLDIGRLYPGPWSADEPVEVLELGLAQRALVNSYSGNLSGEHVLTIAVDRHPNGSWSLDYTWLSAPVNWSIVSATAMPNVEAADETVPFALNVTSVVVDIVPLSGWKQLVINARPHGNAVGGPPPLISPTFDMPPAAPDARNLPVRLRSGVLGGDLEAGMQTQYLFTSPVITNQQ